MSKAATLLEETLAEWFRRIIVPSKKTLRNEHLRFPSNVRVVNTRGESDSISVASDRDATEARRKGTGNRRRKVVIDGLRT